MTTQSQTQVAALRTALSWRLLLAWLLAALIPSLAASVPMSAQLGELLDHVPHGHELTHKLNPLILIDTMVQIGAHLEAISGALIAAVVLTLLLAPFAAGLAVAAYPEPPARFFALLAGAFDNYGRLFRLMLVSILPLGFAGGVGSLLSWLAHEHAEKAVLESSTTTAAHLALIVTVLLVLLAEITVEAARAHFAADSTLRSAFRAWGRGIELLAARPGAVLGRFLVPTIASLAVASLLAVWRVHAGATIGFVVAQLAVVAIGWGRAGRILALAELASHTKR